MRKKEGQERLKAVTKEMKSGSRELEFERAAELRDMVFEREGTAKAIG